jgi:hypothetical protein
VVRVEKPTAKVSLGGNQAGIFVRFNFRNWKVTVRGMRVSIWVLQAESAVQFRQALLQRCDIPGVDRLQLTEIFLIDVRDLSGLDA